MRVQPRTALPAPMPGDTPPAPDAPKLEYGFRYRYLLFDAGVRYALLVLLRFSMLPLWAFWAAQIVLGVSVTAYVYTRTGKVAAKNHVDEKQLLNTDSAGS